MFSFVLTILISITANAAPTAKIQECSPEARALEAQWAAQEPTRPRLRDMARATVLYRTEREHALRLRGDKVRHCYIGCRITTEINPTTGLYLGWLKEHWDLTDCDPSTNFDPADERATAVGVDLAVRHQGLDCRRECESALRGR